MELLPNFRAAGAAFHDPTDEFGVAVEPTSLFSICAIAIVAVFALLSFLAITMHLITVLFPARAHVLNPAVVAAISGTVASVIPGARVTNIEEVR